MEFSIAEATLASGLFTFVIGVVVLPLIEESAEWRFRVGNVLMALGAIAAAGAVYWMIWAEVG